MAGAAPGRPAPDRPRLRRARRPARPDAGVDACGLASPPALSRRQRDTTFVYRVAHNTALTWKRGESRRRRRREAIEVELALRREADDAPEAGLLDRLYDAIRALPPLDRSLVLLSLDGQPYAEIAHVHGLSETNVGARLSRIRRRLSDLVEKRADGV